MLYLLLESALFVIVFCFVVPGTILFAALKHPHDHRHP